MQVSDSGRPPIPRGRVAVTLTGRGGEELADLARAAGWDVALWPGLVFAPTGQELTAAHLQADWVVVTSPQGAASLGAALSDQGSGPLAFNGTKLAAVGGGTAQALRRWGREADFVPSRADARTLAAELPAAPGECALHVTGKQSREQLQQGLVARGVECRRVELYTARPPVYSQQARGELLRADRVVVGSGVAVRGLAEQLGTHLPLLAMGKQTAEAARAAGFGMVVQAKEPSLQGVMAALEEFRRT